MTTSSEAGYEDVTINIGLDSHLVLTASKSVSEPTLVLIGHDDSFRDLPYDLGDSVLAETLEEVRSSRFASTKHTFVTSSGLALALELLSNGELDPKSPITWDLHVPLLECLETLSRSGLAGEAVITNVSGQIERALVTTSSGSGSVLDFKSFAIGLQTAKTLAIRRVDNSLSDAHAEDKENSEMIREKLLSILESVRSPDLQSVKGTAKSSSDARRSVENELILIKRKFDALERKYQALSSSKLGRVTLLLWKRKRDLQSLNSPLKGLRS